MTTEPADPNLPPPPRPRRLGRRLLVGAVALVLVVTLTVAAGAWWAVGSARGSAWLLSVLPGVRVEGPSGALAGDFHAQQLVVDLGSGGDRATLTDVGWRGLSLSGGDGKLWARLTIAALYAAKVEVAMTAKPEPEKKSEPLKPPSNLDLPFELELESLKVGEIHATPLGAAAIRDLDAALHLGADAGAVHRIEHLALRYEQIAVAGQARIASAAPMLLDATVEASQAAQAASAGASQASGMAGRVPSWAMKLHLAGPLAEPVVDANLRAAPLVLAERAAPTTTPGSSARSAAAPGPAALAAAARGPAARSASAPGRAASAAPPSPNAAPATRTTDQAGQTLDLHATLRPFASWPLGDLTASTRALDLSAFVASAPSTSLDVQARATSSGADRPAVVTVTLSNAAPGRYDEGRLPVQSLSAEMTARPDRATEIELRSLDVALGSVADKSDGRISAQGRWSPTRWQVDAALQALKPRRLDNRAPALTLTGPVNAAGGAAAADGKGIDLKTALTGQLDDAGTRRPVAVQLDTSLDLAGPNRRLRIATLAASAGNATLKGSGTATQAEPTAPWVVKADAALADFDPGVWLPGDDKSPWRATRNHINAHVAIDASAPVPATGTPVLDALVQARGRATLVIAGNTVLAGVPLAGKAAVQSDRGDEARIQADLDAGGNSLKVDGRLGTTGKASATDAVDLALDARMLATLAPVFKLFQPATADATLAGRLTAHAHLEGRWPKLTTRGDLDARELRVGTLTLHGAAAQWVVGTAANDRVSLNATLDELKVQPKGGAPGPSLEAATVQLAGTARSHTLDLRLSSRVRPPAWTDALTAGTAPAPAAGPTSAATSSGRVAPATRLTVASLTARGGLVDQPGAALSGWRGTLQTIDIASNAARAAPLLRGHDLSLEAFWAGGPAHAAARPGRLELLGGAVRWSRLSYAAAPAAANHPAGRARSTEPAAAALPRIDVDATIEPLRIAPLLAQAQPSFGWGGDLRLGGHIRIVTGASAPGGLRADAVLERSGGDLTINDELGTRSLGLTDTRATLTADRGLWNARARLSGSLLGTATIDASLRTPAQALVPSADAPLSGRVDLDIGDLGSFGSWVPPGWRIGGALRADATLGGRLGKPDYTGQVVGSRITARNFLEGVSASDGDLLVRLAGNTATIDHFTAKGGDGTLRVTGGATFDGEPDVRLDITATRFQVLGRIDRKVVASGKAAVRIDARALAVNGQFTVDQGLFDITRSDAPKLDEDVTVIRAAGVLSPEAAASAAASPGNNAPLPTVPAVVGPPASEPPAPVRAVDLNLQVDLGQQLAIRGHGLAARLGGLLKVTSPDSKLAVNGTVSVVDGTFKAYGQDLVIDRGMIVFSGPLDRPRLDIEATRPKLENIRVGVTISGSTANPRIRLFSEPELSDVDKLSWLVVGRGSDDLGRNESALLQSAAMALVSGEGNGEPGITDRVTKALGLDELSLGQSDGTVKQTVVNVGKKLSDRWAIGYQGGLNAATGSVQLIYKIAKRLTVRAQAGSESSLDLIWTWRWQ